MFRTLKIALSGDKVTITCTPDNGYMLGTCTVMTDADPAEEVKLTFDETSGTYTFTMPSGNVTISAIFVEEQPGGGDGDDGDDLDPVANTEVGYTEPTACVINGNLLLSVPELAEAALFNFSGRALRRLRLPVGDTWINDLPVGFYIVCFDGKKVVKLVINR